MPSNREFLRSVTPASLKAAAQELLQKKAQDASDMKNPSVDQTDFLSADMERLLNEQIGNEMFSAYLYMSMAGYMDAQGLDGFVAFFQKASCEEMQHTRKLHDFMLKTGSKAILPAIDKPDDDFDSVKAAVQASLEHEKKITADWRKIVAQARKDDDAPTEELAQWFCTEQIEEEEKVVKLLQRVVAAGDGLGVVVVDGQLREEFED